MDTGIYRMSLVENLLVLVVIALWFLAIVNLFRKLERICNPPSIFINYSLHNNLSSSPSNVIHECYVNTLIEPTTSSSIHVTRATSVPVIDDMSSRTTVLAATSPPKKTSICTEISIEEGGVKNDSYTASQQLDTMSVEIAPCPKYIPRIVKQSLLDLHRRALFSNTSFPTSSARRTSMTVDPQTLTRFQLRKKLYQRENAIDEGDWYKNFEPIVK
ncbi:unnamed protein product [Adineta ricciae]|uniref:Uncharacterized protein n=1 Tax=Adineta ricciae TaxID=249248 RepID=A0A814G063_ADIRI|nr:unnamed protein product [Adineta ricciae]